MSDDVVIDAGETGLDASTANEPWRRLSYRVIWVDLARSLVATIPLPIALALGVPPELGTMLPFLILAAVGVLGAVVDLVRWAFTRYRVTPTHVERRTGVLVRTHRTIRRERIRSVDTEAKLHHRIGGLRVVTIGAGQQTAAAESALHLDALATSDAVRLREELLHLHGRPAPEAPLEPEDAAADDAVPDAAVPESAAPRADEEQHTTVLATFRAWWVVYHLFSIWAYVMAAGLLWGGYWFAMTFGVDLLQLSGRVIDRDALDPVGTAVAVLVIGGVVGAVAMGIYYLVSFWRFELARVRTEGTTFLRTRRGLLNTREVNRDEARMRGLSIGEPLLGRLIGMADTNGTRPSRPRSSPAGRSASPGASRARCSAHRRRSTPRCAVTRVPHWSSASYGRRVSAPWPQPWWQLPSSPGLSPRGSAGCRSGCGCWGCSGRSSPTGPSGTRSRGTTSWSAPA